MTEARALHEELISLSIRAYIPNTALMLSSAAVRDLDLAIEYTLQACDEREPILILLARNFPDTQRLRDDPRFAEVLRRLGLS
jgi:hypothetical protein